MPGDCSNSWQPFGCGWSIGYLWHSTFLMERLVLLLLALMLAGTVLIGVRFSYLLAKRPKVTETTSHTRSKLTAELCLKLRSLRSTSSTAPYLGLLGTTLGILDTLSSLGEGTRLTILNWLVSGIAAAFLSTAAGILVAIVATCLHNYFRTRLDSLDSELPSGSAEKTRLLLRPRVSSFPFPLTAVPILVASIAAFMVFPSFYGPRGLRVRLIATRASEMKVASPAPVVIAIVSTKADVVPIVYLDSNKTTWDELRNKLQSELEVRPPGSIVHVQADDDIFWQHVMYVIEVAEGLHAEVVLLTIKPEVHRSRRLTR
jgi:biopolymer transport protein ExbD